MVSSEYDDGRRIWDCVVSSGNEWHYIVPAGDRIRRLLNANPLHVDRDVVVSD